MVLSSPPSSLCPLPCIEIWGISAAVFLNNLKKLLSSESVNRRETDGFFGYIQDKRKRVVRKKRKERKVIITVIINDFNK